MSKRIIYLDWVKSLAIFLVLFYHFNPMNLNYTPEKMFVWNFNYFVTTLSVMGVPLFFMVNGALMLDRKPLLRKHVHKVLKLIFLLIIWKFITVLILNSKFDNEGNIIDYINLLVTNSFPGIDIVHFWFMNALISLYLILPFFQLAYQSNKKLIHYIVAVLLIFPFVINLGLHINDYLMWKYENKIFKIGDLNVLSSFGTYSYAFTYFLLGGILKDIFQRKQARRFRWASLIIFIFSWYLLSLTGSILTNVYSSYYDTVYYGYSSIFTILMALSTFYFFSGIQFNNRLNTHIASETLGIYFLHWIIGYYISEHFFSYLNPESLINNILKSVILLIFSLAASIFIKKLPFGDKLLKI
jgi:surface polysaccharide O-acyltransferase-like enzyme